MVIRNALVILSLTAAAVLAGCATPNENVNPTDGLPESTGGEDTAEYVMIDGRPYECHDTLNADGVCDDYELDEGYTGADDAMQVTSSGGSVQIGDHTYECADTMGSDIDVTDTTDDTGRCETYKLVS